MVLRAEAASIGLGQKDRTIDRSRQSCRAKRVREVAAGGDDHRVGGTVSELGLRDQGRGLEAVGSTDAGRHDGLGGLPTVM